MGKKVKKKSRQKKVGTLLDIYPSQLAKPHSSWLAVDKKKIFYSLRENKMLKMIKNLAHTARATKFAGQSPVLSGKVISMTTKLDQVAGGSPRIILVPNPKDKV